MSDYSEETNIPGGFKLDAFIPIVLLAASFILLLGWQISITNTQRGQLDSAITRQTPLATQSQKVQDGVSKLVSDLLTAAQTDPGAKAIVDKYQIKSAEAAGAAGASASPGL
jgi:hypothetical protein